MNGTRALVAPALLILAALVGCQTMSDQDRSDLEAGRKSRQGTTTTTTTVTLGPAAPVPAPGTTTTTVVVTPAPAPPAPAAPEPTEAEILAELARQARQAYVLKQADIADKRAALSAAERDVSTATAEVTRLEGVLGKSMSTDRATIGGQVDAARAVVVDKTKARDAAKAALEVLVPPPSKK